jgi:XTP/dITP diphosphohydrolase
MQGTRRVLALASGNKHKLQEFGEILGPAGWKVESIRHWVPDLSDPDETEPDFPGNARLKLSHATALLKGTSHRPGPDAVAADDSGLSVSILGGAPGVFSARFAELAGSGSGDADNRRELRRRLALAGLSGSDTTPAAFACAIAFLHLESGRLVEAFAECEGRVGSLERGAGGFGYDPLFFPILPGRILSEGTFSELPSPTKHSLSHRGKALSRLARAVESVA